MLLRATKLVGEHKGMPREMRHISNMQGEKQRKRPADLPRSGKFENGLAPTGVLQAVGEKLATGEPKVNHKVSIRIGSANVGSMSGRSGEVVDMVERRQLDFCCLQETRWKGGRAKVIGTYKFYWVGCRDGTAGVGILVSRKWIENVIEVKRVSERILLLRLGIGKKVINLVSAYAPQVGRAKEEKEQFFAKLSKVVVEVKSDEGLYLCGDLNGHVGEKAEGYEGVHGGCGYGSRNAEGEMILELAESLDLAVTNTWFRKEDKLKVTYESGGCRSVIDYVLVRAQERKQVRDTKVIPNEVCLSQHKLLICVVDMAACMRRNKRTVVRKLKVWKLKEAVKQEEFREKLQSRERGEVEETVEGLWGELKNSLVEATEKVCGRTTGRSNHKETWWWTEETKAAVDEKRKLYVIWKKSKDEEDRRQYNIAKCSAKKVIVKAQEVERQKFVHELESEYNKGNIFRMAKQITSAGRDVSGGTCVKGKDGKIAVEDSEIRQVWKDYYSNLLNEEFDWNREGLETVDPVVGPGEEFTYQEVKAAIALTKNGKAAGPSEVVSDMLKASGVAGAQMVTKLCNAVAKENKIPSDWTKSLMVNVYKGKGDALECGSYRGIKLIDHVMKVLERVVEKRIRRVVHIDDMQFGFRPGRGATDAIFIVRQIQEKYLAKSKELWIAFVDLEKAFDRVPRDVVWWALRKVGVEEWLINVIRAMYTGTTTAVRVKGGVSEEFEVKVGVHQGSVLSPLLFTIVLEALSRDFRGGLPLELLYADDLALLAETEEALLEKVRIWKEGMESKGLRVNMAKTKVMKCSRDLGQKEVLGKYPCGVCKKGVGANSILCSSCSKWIHKRCSGLSGKLKDDPNFKCRTCVNADGRGPVQVTVKSELADGGTMERVDTFCYLGDMIGSGGGVEEATRTRVRCAWGKFNELAPILTKRGVSLKVKGKIYQACVQRVLVYASETWAMKVEDVRRMERTENSMIRRMCGVRQQQRFTMESLRQRLSMEGVSVVMRRSRLAWFGHLERKDECDWVSGCRNMVVGGQRGKGRPSKTWQEGINSDMKALGLCKDVAKDRLAWRRGIFGKNV